MFDRLRMMWRIIRHTTRFVEVEENGNLYIKIQGGAVGIEKDNGTDRLGRPKTTITVVTKHETHDLIRDRQPGQSKAVALLNVVELKAPRKQKKEVPIATQNSGTTVEGIPKGTREAAGER